MENNNQNGTAVTTTPSETPINYGMEYQAYAGNDYAANYYAGNWNSGQAATTENYSNLYVAPPPPPPDGSTEYYDMQPQTYV